MLSLVILFSTLIIQFGATEFPIDIISLNADHEYAVQLMVNSINSTFGYSLDYTKAIVVTRNNSTYPYYLYYPEESINPNFVSSGPTTWVRYDDRLVVSGANFRRFQIKSNYAYATGYSTSINSIGDIYYDSTLNNKGLFYTYYYTFPVDEVPTFKVSIDNNVPVLPTGHSFGSLTNAFFDENGDPLYELKQHSNGGGWSSNVTGYSVTGHSSGVSSSSSSFDFTNPTQNLLGQLIDNTDDLISNTNLLGNAFSSLNNNLINGFSSLFNGVSVFNSNVVGFLTYLTEPLDSEEISTAFLDTSFYTTFEEVETLSQDISSSVSSNVTDHANGSSLNYTLNIDSEILGTFSKTLDFSWLDDTKSTWQPLLIALLYFSLVTTVLHTIPSIIQGAKGGSSSSD